MKFVKSNLAKKIIIALIVILIFNVTVPVQVNAGIVDTIVNAAGGILFIPLKFLLLSVTSNINLTIGRLLRGVGGTVDDILKAITDDFNPDNIVDSIGKAVSHLFIGPENIFAGDIDILNANVFKKINGGKIGSIVSFFLSDLNPGESIGNNVRVVTANIYIVLRDICALVMLAGLIYTGIRILITSNIPSKKMQYLMLLEDWVMGMVLLIFSHIIMIIIFEISEGFVSLLSNSLTFGGDNSSGLTFTIVWNAVKNVGLTEALTYTILYIYMTWLVVVFAISYFKRFFWIVVLTIFAPVVSIMYAFGQQTKQIYSRWLKEYTMTVFTQPFHMLVYYVLVMIPMGIASGTGSFNQNSGLTAMLYALIAMSFIRPFEKYLRELFGMDKGIAGAGSYDSGVQPIKAAAAGAMKIASIAATAYGGPAAGAAVNAAADAIKGGDGGSEDADGATLPAEDEDDVSSSDLALESAEDEVANEKLNSSTPQVSGMIGKRDEIGNKPDSFESDGNPAALGPGDVSPVEEDDTEALQSELKQIEATRRSNNSKLGALTRRENQIKGNHDPHEVYEYNGMESVYTDEEEEQLDEISASRRAIKEQNGSLDNRAEEIRSTLAERESNKKEEKNEEDDLEQGKQGSGNGGLPGNGTISVGNLTINASNISLNGNATGGAIGVGKQPGDGTGVEEGDGKEGLGAGKSNTKPGAKNEDENMSITDGKNQGGGYRFRDYVTGKAAAGQLASAHDMLTGKKGMVETAQNWLQNGKIASPYRWLGKGIDKMADSKIPIVRSLGKGGMKVKDMAKNGLAFADRFEKAGGFAEVYKTVNSVRDSMFIGGAPGDWKGTAEQMDANKKRRDEQAIYNFSHNEGNKTYMLNQGGLLAKYQDIYKGRTDVNQAYIKNKAEQEAESRLESMAKSYVPYGITDVGLANSLKNDQKKYGYTPEQAIIQAHRFNKFDVNKHNIVTVNSSYKDIPHNDPAPVSAKIDNARDYYDRGITNIETMINADQIAVKLSQQLGDKLSDQMKKDIAVALAKKGGAEYTGSDADIKKVIAELTKRKG